MRHSIAVLCSSTVFFFLVCAAAHVNAQSDETQTAPKNSLVKGAWALQFKVDSDAILSEFGGSVAIKRHVSAQSAFRVGFDYGVEIQDMELVDGGQYDRDYETFGLFVDYLRYTDVESPIHFFWGTGPFGSFTHEKNTETENTENTAKHWDVGLSGRVGVEWFATRSVSFHAEYFGTVYYQRRSSKVTDLSSAELGSYENTSDTWRLTRGPAVFGLSAYF